MKRSQTTTLLLLLCLITMAACDSGTPPTPISATSTPTAPQQPTQATQATATQAPIDTAFVPTPTTSNVEVPTPTPVKAVATGAPVTALQALSQLKAKALSWQPDARLVMLANVKPGQAVRLLGVALGDPYINEPTPGGKGRDWSLLAVSPSTKDVMAFSMDGSQADLVKEGKVADTLMATLTAPSLSALDLSKLDISKLKDSDAITASAGARGSRPNVGLALLAPDGLGVGPLPTPQAGGPSSQLAYELFSSDPAQQTFIFFDAFSGDIVLDSSAPH